MRFTRPISQRVVLAYSLSLAATALLGLVPWAVVAAQTPDKPAPKEATYSGKFVSYKAGLLTVQGDEGKELAWKVAEDTKTVMFLKGVEKESIAGDAFKLVEPGMLTTVETKDESVVLIQLGKKSDRVPDKAAPKERIERGRFVSFKDGLLTLKANSGAVFGTQIPENAKILVWNYDEGAYKSVGTAEALKQLQPGSFAWFVVRIGKDNVTIHIGARKGQTVGTFVSFKDDRLLLLGKNLGESFVKKYGNSVHFHKFREDVPVYESIDGSEYKLAGTPGSTLGKLKEGTVLTVHGEGDDNITLIQIGVPKKD